MDSLIGSKQAEVLNKIINGNKLVQSQVDAYFQIGLFQAFFFLLYDNF